MMVWSDNSEFIIYRTLKQVRNLVKRMNSIATSGAKEDLAESTKGLLKAGSAPKFFKIKLDSKLNLTQNQIRQKPN